MLQPATYSHSSIDSLRSFLFGLRASCMFFFFVHVKCLWPWYQIRLHSHFSSILWIFKKCGVYQHVQRWQISTTTAESSAAASQGAALVETWDPWQPVPMPCRKRVWQKKQRMILSDFVGWANIHSPLIPFFSFGVLFKSVLDCESCVYSDYILSIHKDSSKSSSRWRWLVPSLALQVWLWSWWTRSDGQPVVWGTAGRTGRTATFVGSSRHSTFSSIILVASWRTMNNFCSWFLCTAFHSNSRLHIHSYLYTWDLLCFCEGRRISACNHCFGISDSNASWMLHSAILLGSAFKI